MAEAEAQRQPLTKSLSAGEDDWQWKMGFRSTLLVLDIVGIGCIGWAVGYVTHEDTFDMFYDTWALPWGLITLSLSFIWCFIVVLVLVLRKRPVHPGCVVGIDLILWMALIVTGLFAVAAAWSISSFGRSGRIYDPTSSGYYLYQDNGTWTWNASSYYSYYYNGGSGSRRDCSEYFKNCAAQDAYINGLWENRARVAATEIVATATQFLGVLLHLALFVWGCVDVHRRRRSRTTNQARKIAEKIIQDMAARGQIVPMQNMTQPLLAPAAPPLQRNSTTSSVDPQTPLAAPQSVFIPQQPPPQLQPGQPHVPQGGAVSPISPMAPPFSSGPDAIEPAPRQPHAS